MRYKQQAFAIIDTDLAADRARVSTCSGGLDLAEPGHVPPMVLGLCCLDVKGGVRSKWNAGAQTPIHLRPR
jgi:hypothetical protein